MLTEKRLREILECAHQRLLDGIPNGDEYIEKALREDKAARSLLLSAIEGDSTQEQIATELRSEIWAINAALHAYISEAKPITKEFA